MRRPKALKRIFKELDTGMKRSILDYVFELTMVVAIATVLQILAVISILMHTEETALTNIALLLLMFSTPLFVAAIYVLWRSLTSLTRE